MDSKKTVFLTGATGLVASYLLKLLLENGNKVYALARSNKEGGAYDRVVKLLEFWADDGGVKNLENLKVIEGDITLDNLGIDNEDLKELILEVEIIFHSAALAELRVELEKIRRINVSGTKKVLDFSLACKNLKKFNHISTTYVVGTKMGIEFSENMLDVGQGFHNSYEQSKYEAEVLVNEYKEKGLNISIFRPSMVMGHSVTGKTTNFRLIYEPFHFFSKDIYDVFPADGKCFQNLINIDTVAKAIFLLGEREERDVYHISSPEHVDVDFIMETASEYFGFKLPKFIPIQKFDFNRWSPVKKMLADPFEPYFNFNTKFMSQRTENILKEYSFKYPKIDKNSLYNIYRFCDQSGFIRRRR